MASTPLTATAAASAGSFVSSLGINTHFDFNNYGYQNLAVTEQAINYLGIKNLRDSGMNPSDAQTWLQVANATGAKFDDYMPEGSPASLQSTLGLMPALAREGILNYVEGGNEDDDPYAIENGNTLAWTAQFQQQVYQVGHSYGLPVINMSFGAGWTSANNWQGDYGAVGDLSAYTDYGNAHTYPLIDQMPDGVLQRLDGLAKLAASSRPVITTEVGWDENMGFTQSDVARYVVDAALDGWKNGDVKTYFYALYDDGSGRFGLMNQDGTAKPAGKALHNLTTLLADTGAGTFTPGALTYGLSGMHGAEKTVLLQKSDGTNWIAVWDETDGAHNVTLTLGAAATKIVVFDPVTGTSAIQTLNNASAVSLTLQGDPLLVEVIGGASTITPGPTETPTPTPPPTSPTPPSTGLTPNDLAVTVPGAGTVHTGSTLAITGVSITDAWAASCPGLMALNLWDSSGAALTVNGQVVNGTIHGTLAELNADLATLSYKAGSVGGDTITVDVWNQAGVEVTRTIGMTVSAAAAPPPPPPVTTPTPAPSATTTTVAAGDANPVIMLDHATINAMAGNHMFFIGGSFNKITVSGGTEKVLAFQGHNSISTGKGDNSIQIAGSGNTVNAGLGNNRIEDAGSDNRIILGRAGVSHADVYGYVLQNQDIIDMRSMLAGTKWGGDRASLGNFLHERTINGSDTVISVTPSGVGGSASYDVATLHGTGPVSMDNLLAHSAI